MRWRDRIVAIVLGVVLGIAVVTFFVFGFSEQTVDAPSLSGGEAGEAGRPGGGERAAPPVATVRVIHGDPPASGPAQLRYRRGDPVRIRAISDRLVRLVLQGYGVARTVPAGRPTPIRFRATRPGSFPLVVSDSHIGVAELRVGGAPGP